ncbi:MAG: nitronate monooxygenase [Magnetococcales bacterium]|nr:nitronate monooxygenase [Magnetococcales bacterium]
MTSHTVPPDSWARGAAFLGTRHPVLGGAMSWLSERHLVAAISNAGGFGVLATGSMPVELAREEVRATRALTSQPFGINLITMNPDLPAYVEMVIAERMTHCVLAGGIPRNDTIDALRSAGIRVILFAPSLALARRLIQRGAEALIIEGHEAGGHVGPVSTTVLAQEILPHVRGEVPVFVAGGIANAEMTAAMAGLGAAGVQVGTRFVCAAECIAHDNFKQCFIRAQSRDAQVTVQFDPALPVIPVRALVNKGTERFNQLQMALLQEVREGRKARADAQLDLERFWAGALRRAAIDGDVEHGSVMAGQSVGLVRSIQPAAEIIAELVAGVGSGYQMVCNA